jgi:hypothetical protein
LLGEPSLKYLIAASSLARQFTECRTRTDHAHERGYHCTVAVQKDQESVPNQFVRKEAAADAKGSVAQAGQPPAKLTASDVIVGASSLVSIVSGGHGDGLYDARGSPNSGIHAQRSKSK